MCAACAAVALLAGAAGRAAGEEDIRLPDPAARAGVSLEQALSRSRTLREYSSQPLSLNELSYVLWAAGGGRFDAIGTASLSYPSAGAIYPARIYLLAAAVEGLEPGSYQYIPREHVLRRLRSGDMRREAVAGSPLAGFVRLAPATVILAADDTRSTVAFGERGERLYVGMDTGHVSQTLRLAAAAAGLGVGIAGQFDHATVATVLAIPEEPLLLLTLGHPWKPSREQ